MPRSFTVVADLLQDTIDRSAKSQSDTDGELAWLRRRLANQHRDQQLRAKEIQEAGDKASHKPRELFKQHGDKIDVLGGKENTSLINLAGPQVCICSVVPFLRFLAPLRSDQNPNFISNRCLSKSSLREYPCTLPLKLVVKLS